MLVEDETEGEGERDGRETAQKGDGDGEEHERKTPKRGAKGKEEEGTPKKVGLTEIPLN